MFGKRSATLLVLALLLISGMSLFMGSCATLGKGKDAEADSESDQMVASQQAEQQQAVQEQAVLAAASGSSAEGRQSAAADPGRERARAWKWPSAVSDTWGRLRQAVANGIDGLRRLLPESLASITLPQINLPKISLPRIRLPQIKLPSPELTIDWSRVLTAGVGIAILLGIYGTAIWLGRMPARRRG